MDLAAEAERLRLDLLAVQVCEALDEAGIGHVLLKGPSTANWLYDPPRTYCDVDLLVPASRLQAAADALAAAGLARPKGGLPGEEAHHSLLLASDAGFEVDLHLSLPSVPVHGDAVWTALAGHRSPLDLGVGVVPALDEPARCLVLALHALGNPVGTEQPVEDLRRAWDRAERSSWSIAARIADELAVRDLFDAGVGMVAPDHRPAATSPRSRLYASAAPSGAFALERFAAARRRDLPALIAREIVPSRGFMIGYQAAPIETRRELMRAHLTRWRFLARELPGAVRAWRAARRDDANSETTR